MKRIITLLVIIIMLFSLISCAGVEASVGASKEEKLKRLREEAIRWGKKYNEALDKGDYEKAEYYGKILDDIAEEYEELEADIETERRAETFTYNTKFDFDEELKKYEIITLGELMKIADNCNADFDFDVSFHIYPDKRRVEYDRWKVVKPYGQLIGIADHTKPRIDKIMEEKFYKDILVVFFMCDGTFKQVCLKGIKK